MDERGGPGPAVLVRWVPAHRAGRQVTDGAITYRDWVGKMNADLAAKAAAYQGRVPAEDRSILISVRKQVEL
eukprot:7853213-Pyramimonas_sp.AAC.1